MNNRLELLSDGYRLHPKRYAYLKANLFGIFLGLLGLAMVGIVTHGLLMAPRASHHVGDLIVAVAVTVVFMGSLGFVGWFTSRPPVLTVTGDQVTLLGGAHRRRAPRADIVGVYRGAVPTKTGRDRTSFIVLSTPRAISIPVRHFDEAGLEDALHRLGVPMAGDFKQVVDEFSVGQFFRGAAA